MLAAQLLNKLDNEFISRKNFNEVVERISQKLSSRRHYLEKADFGGSDLKLILENPDYFYKSILDYLSKHSFQSYPTNKIQIITNKKRDIYISTWSERILFMMAQNTLAKIAEPFFIPELYSFRKGKGPYDAREGLLRYLNLYKKNELYLFQGDVKSYGDNIDSELLLMELHQKFNISKESVLFQVISSGIKSQYQLSNEQTHQLEKGIPSGSPLVPVLENIYLCGLDSKISSIPNMFYARYGDDFIFLNPSKEQMIKAENILFEELQSKKLEIKKEKTNSVILSSKTHLLTNERKKYFQWIGFSFHSTANSTTKEIHYKKIKSALHMETNQYFKKISVLDHLSDEKICQIIIPALVQIYSNNSNIKKMLKDTTDAAYIKLFIENEVLFLKKMIQFHLKRNTKRSWKIVRSTKFGIGFFL